MSSSVQTWPCASLAARTRGVAWRAPYLGLVQELDGDSDGAAHFCGGGIGGWVVAVNWLETVGVRGVVKVGWRTQSRRIGGKERAQGATMHALHIVAAELRGQAAILHLRLVDGVGGVVKLSVCVDHQRQLHVDDNNKVTNWFVI